MPTRYLSWLARSLPFSFIVFVTFIAAYAPTVSAALHSGAKARFLDVLKQPDVIGGIMGLLFSTLLAIGEKHNGDLKAAIEALRDGITAQRRAGDLQERFLSTKSGSFAPLFGRLAERRMAKLTNDFENIINNKFYTVRQTNPVHEYIDIFVSLMLEIIQPHSEFRVVTNEPIWSSDSFGSPDRRYLLANHVAATKRNIRIRRIFTVRANQGPSGDGSGNNPADMTRLARFREMLREHQRILTGPHVDLSVYEISSDSEYHSFFTYPSNNFAIWQVADEVRICTVVEYSRRSDGRYGIDGIRFDSDSRLIAEKEATFEDLRSQAKDVGDYLRELDARLKQQDLTRSPASGLNEHNPAPTTA